MIFFLILGSHIGNATPVHGTLYLGDEVGENEITLTLSAFTFASSQTTIYSGTIDFEMILEGGAVTGFKMSGGTIDATDSSFVFESPFIFSQMVNVIDYRAVPKSLNGMETLVTPGIFDANQHVFFFNEGRTVSDGTFGASESFVSDDPFNANGITTGSIILANPQLVTSTITGGEIATKYDVDFLVTLDSMSFPDPDDLTSFIETVGIVTARGQVMAYTHPFYDWAANNFPEAGNALAFTADMNGDGVADGISWALGQPVGFQETLELTYQKAEHQMQLILPDTGTRAPVSIQTSRTLALGSWMNVEGSDLSTGENPLLIGTNGPVTVSLPVGSKGFYRLSTTKP